MRSILRFTHRNNQTIMLPILYLFCLITIVLAFAPGRASAVDVPDSVTKSFLPILVNASAQSIARTVSGYVVAGYQLNPEPEGDLTRWAVIMTLDQDLAFPNIYTFHDASNHNSANQVIAVHDGFVMTGWRYKHYPTEPPPDGDPHWYDPWVWLVKMNLGLTAVLWEHRFGSPFGDRGNSVTFDPGNPSEPDDNGYVVAGFLGISTLADHGGGFLIRTDDGGTHQWDIQRPPYVSETEWAIPELHSVQKTANNGLILGTGAGIVKLDMNLTPPPDPPIPHYTLAWRAGTGCYYSARQTDDDGDGEFDDGYIAVGSLHTGGVPGYKDLVLTKFRADGTQDWSYTFGRAEPALGATGMNDEGMDVIQADSGGYAVVGYTQSYGWHGSDDLWFIKTDSGGAMEWDLSLGGDGYDRGYELVQAANGNYVLAGRVREGEVSRMWILSVADTAYQPPEPAFTPEEGSVFFIEKSIEFNASGSGDPDGEIVSYEWNFGDGQFGSGVITDHAYVHPGTYSVTLYVTDNHGIRRDVSHDITTVALQPQWEKSYGRYRDWGKGLSHARGGGFVVTGMRHRSGGNDFDLWAFKTDSRGNVLWEKTFQDTWTGFRKAIGQDVVRAHGADGGYIIAGESERALVVDQQTHYVWRIWILKLDEHTGDKVWEKHFEGTAGEGELNWNDRVYDIARIPEGGYIITGYTCTRDETTGLGDCNVWLIKINNDGSESWNSILEDSKGASGEGRAVAVTDDGGYIVTGQYRVPPDRPILIMKADADGEYEWQSFANPVSGSISQTHGDFVMQTEDSGYVVGGLHDREFCVTKIPPNGSGFDWFHTWSPSGSNLVHGGDTTPLGGVILTGSVDDWDDYDDDLYIMRADKDGELAWEQRWPVEGTAENGRAVLSLPNGGFVVLADRYLVSEGSTYLMKVGANTPPTAEFTFSPADPMVGQTISFDVTSAEDPDGTVEFYDWDFGDGTRMTEDLTTVEHLYLEPGTYPVTMGAVDDGGAVFAVTHDVDVGGDSAVIIAMGSTTPGSIDAGAEVDVYKFWGHQDRRVIIDLTRTSGDLDLEADLYAADGTLLTQGSGAETLRLEYDLPEYAYYYILVRDAGQDGTGEYDLHIVFDNTDSDGDGILDSADNCPAVHNPGQENGDGDGVGDACDDCPADPDNDVDGDGDCGDVDNCPADSNPGQEDGDGDGAGDACDACPADPDNDVDGDGDCGDVDNCPFVPNPGQEDGDSDGAGDVCDNCPVDTNPGQENLDGDSLGDACDDDADGDSHSTPTDCDDRDASIYPGASETPYDGIDQDCTGADLTDVDGDGFDSVLAGGHDSNDNDAGMTPATEQGPGGDDTDYDGNGDSTADHTQPHVTSLPTFDGEGYVTIASPPGTVMSDVAATGNPSPGDSPEGVEFPHGFFNFTIHGIGLGGSTTVTLYLPSGAAPDVYYKHGPLPAVPVSDWYRFMLVDDGVTGADISGNIITLHFTDRRKGDDVTDMDDGKIIDIGGPGGMEPSQPAPAGDTGSTGGSGANDDGGGGGGGCFVNTVF